MDPKLLLVVVALAFFSAARGLTPSSDIYPYDIDAWINSHHIQTKEVTNNDRSERNRRAESAEPPLYDIFPSKNWDDDLVTSKHAAKIKHFRFDSAPFQTRGTVAGHVWLLENPKGHYSVIEPINGGCAKQSRERTSATASAHHCRVATNAGFFDPRDSMPSFGKCLGSVISKAAFGLLKNGSFVIGMIPAEFVGDGSHFHSLVNGVIWLVRGGASHVAKSMQMEDGSTQFTSNLYDFVNVVSARTAIGFDDQGRLIIVSVDGRTRTDRGITLPEFADLLLSFGVIGAINLDGGGSATSVENGTVVSMPSDPCPEPNDAFLCERRITTINCIYDGDISLPPTRNSPMSSPIGSVEPVSGLDSAPKHKEPLYATPPQPYAVSDPVASPSLYFSPVPIFVLTAMGGCYLAFRLWRNRNAQAPTQPSSSAAVI